MTTLTTSPVCLNLSRITPGVRLGMLITLIHRLGEMGFVLDPNADLMSVRCLTLFRRPLHDRNVIELSPNAAHATPEYLHVTVPTDITQVKAAFDLFYSLAVSGLTVRVDYGAGVLATFTPDGYVITGAHFSLMFAWCFTANLTFSALYRR